jgi:hypothetical protein
MLRGLFRCVVRLHPSSFRRRFGDEMLYIFDQQKGALAELNAMLDGIFSLLKQWILRPHRGMDVPASTLSSPNADNLPLFGTFDMFPPRKSAFICGLMLTPILFFATIFAVPYSGIHFANLPMPWMVAHKTSPRSGTIWLDRYAGEYISKNPPGEISIQVEGDGPGNGHLSLAGVGHSSLTLLPLSSTKFVIIGARNSYADFTTDSQDEICCLSLVVDGKAISARRQ